MNAVDLSGIASLDFNSLRDETFTLFYTFVANRMENIASRSQAKALNRSRELSPAIPNNQMVPSDDWVYRAGNIRIITSCEGGQVTTVIISREIWSVICSVLWSLIELLINEFESFVHRDAEAETATITEIHSDDDSYHVNASASDLSCEPETSTEIRSDGSFDTIDSSYNVSGSDSSCYEPSMSPTTLQSKLYQLYHKND